MDATPKKGSKSQVRTLYIKTTNALFIYINGKKISLNSSYKVAPLKNDNFISVKIQGIFNSKETKINCPNFEVRIIEQPFAKNKKLNSNLVYKKRIALKKARKISLLKTDLIKDQNYKNLSFNKSFKLKPNNQSLKTININ